MNKTHKISFFRKLYDYCFAAYKYRGLCAVRSGKWTEEVRTRVISNKNKNVEDYLPDYARGKHDPEFLREVFLICTENTFDNKKERPEDEDVFYIERSDIFDNEKVMALLAEGYNRMQNSIDPAHGWAHVRRVLRFSNILWLSLPEDERPDWGTVLISVVWHDVARVDRLGPADDYWPWLKKIPFMQDISIIITAIRDASRSASMLNLACKRHNLPTKLRRTLTRAIGKTSNLEVRKGKKGYIRKTSVIADIVHDADILDLITIGRMEDIFQKARDTDFIDEKFYDRFLAVFFFFGIGVMRQRFLLAHSKDIYNITASFSDTYCSLFYPQFLDKFRDVMQPEF